MIGPNLGEPTVLRVGEVAQFPGEGLRIGFTSVDEDSRCPPDVVCVWAGVAKVAAWAEMAPKPRAEFVLATNNAVGPSEARYENYSIELLNLSPRSTGAVPQADYRLTLVVRTKGP